MSVGSVPCGDETRTLRVLSLKVRMPLLGSEKTSGTTSWEFGIVICGPFSSEKERLPENL